jgi:hypothetical protein
MWQGPIMDFLMVVDVVGLSSDKRGLRLVAALVRELRLRGAVTIPRRSRLK